MNFSPSLTIGFPHIENVSHPTAPLKILLLIAVTFLPCGPCTVICCSFKYHFSALVPLCCQIIISGNISPPFPSPLKRCIFPYRQLPTNLPFFVASIGHRAPKGPYDHQDVGLRPNPSALRNMLRNMSGEPTKRRQTMYVKVYMSDQEKATLSRLAEKRGLALSQLIYAQLLPLLHDEAEDMAAFDPLSDICL